MVKVAGSFAVFLFVTGLALAQSDAQQPAAKTSKQAGSMAAIQHWHGTLVDASCASGASASTPAAEQTSAQSDKHHKKDNAQTQSCPVSTSTSTFALKTADGQVMKFDPVGSERAAKELKEKGAWTKDLSAGKPIHAKVSGVLNGDTITVTSIG